MTGKAKTNDGKNVVLEAAQMQSALMKQPDFLVPVVQAAVPAILEVERAECLQAGQHERRDQRLGDRRGDYRRGLITRGGTLVWRVPQDRAGHFRTQVFEQYQRSEQALVAALAQLHEAGAGEAQSRESTVYSGASVRAVVVLATLRRNLILSAVVPKGAWNGSQDPHWSMTRRRLLDLSRFGRVAFTFAPIAAGIEHRFCSRESLSQAAGRFRSGASASGFRDTSALAGRDYSLRHYQTDGGTADQRIEGDATLAQYRG